MTKLSFELLSKLETVNMKLENDQRNYRCQTEGTSRYFKIKLKSLAIATAESFIHRKMNDLIRLWEIFAEYIADVKMVSEKQSSFWTEISSDWNKQQSTISCCVSLNKGIAYNSENNKTDFKIVID